MTLCDAVALHCAEDRVPFRHVDVTDIEIRQLRQPQPGRIKKLEHRFVPGYQRSLAAKIQEPCHAISIEVFRQPFTGLRRSDINRRACLDAFLANEITKKRSNGG